MSMHKLAVAALATAFAITASVAFSQKAENKSALSGGDRNLMMKAAQAGLAEVEASKLAAERASNPEVKKFAQRMVQEHEKSNAELKQIASIKGVSLPTTPDAKHQEALKELRGLSGEKFDRQYMARAGVKDHKAALELFRDGAKDARDPQLKAFFEKNLEHIKQHLAMAQDVSKQADGGEGTRRRTKDGGPAGKPDK